VFCIFFFVHHDAVLVGWFGGWGGGHTVMSVVLYIWVDFVNEVAHCSPACLRGKISWCLLLNLVYNSLLGIWSLKKSRECQTC
jgi:hypothetical protein